MFSRLKESWAARRPDIDHALTLDDALLTALERQNKRGCFSLRFEPRLESAFRDHLAASGRAPRLVLFLIFGIMTLTLPWSLTHSIGEPAIVAAKTSVLIYIQSPLMLIGAILVWYKPLLRFIDVYSIIVYCYCISAELAERGIGAQHGFITPLLWVALATTALLVAMRIRFWYAFPFVIIACIAAAMNEAAFVIHSPAGIHNYYAVTVLIELILVASVGGYSLEYFMRKTWISRNLLQYISHHDGLTRILNRQAIHHAMQRTVAHARREQCGFAIAMLDVDFFKSYNDTYGHPAGDEALRKIADTLNEATRRPHDFCGRLGGEEFIVVWSGGQQDDLHELAKFVRTRIEALGLVHKKSTVSPYVTASIGLHYMDASQVPALAQRMTKQPNDAISQLFAHADKQLYNAKKSGRNKVISNISVRKIDAYAQPVVGSLKD